jgi:hypothetical protein
MALQIRRGTDAQRLTITPAEGELIYTTDTKMLFVGDGSTVGGLEIVDGGAPHITALVDDTNPQLGGNLDLNSSDIEGTGNIDINGNVTANNVSADNIYAETTPDATLSLHANGTGYVEVFGALKLTVYADATARDTAIASPIAGQIVFVTDSDGAGNPAFMGYTGAAWVSLN